MNSFSLKKYSFNYDKIINVKNQLFIKEINEVISKVKEEFMMEDNLSFSLSDIAENENELHNRHERLKEMNSLFDAGIYLNMNYIPSLSKTFDDLKRLMSLLPKEINQIGDFLLEVKVIKERFFSLKRYPYFFEETYCLDSLPSVYQEIRRIIKEDNTISSSASIKLKEIRDKKEELEQEIRRVMKSLKDKYSSYLSDNVISYKDGNELLPVKKEYKNQVKGNIYSYSQSQETIFVIPSEIAEKKNQLSYLSISEKQEESVILAALSAKIGKKVEELKKNYLILLSFDRYSAFVSYGRRRDFSIASSGDKFILKGIYHPLLDDAVAKRNDIDLTLKKSLLISGANAGGKSLLIKAVAISVYMDKLGMMIPAREAVFPFIDNIFFLGGDEQSVVNNLSTFQSHLLSIKEIVNEATSFSLVIIDEVCQGTSPKDGEALAVSLLKYFIKLGSYNIFTSHYEELKYFAKNSKDVMCSSMEFSLKEMKPTYHLLNDSISPSYGIELAKKIDIKDEIIKEAIVLRKKRNDKDLTYLIDKLAKEKRQLALEKEKLEKREKDLNEAILKRERAISSLTKEKESILNNAQKKVEKIVSEKIDEINRAYQNKDIKLSYQEVSKIKGDLKKITSKREENREKRIEVKAGDYVRDESDCLMKVIEVKKDEVVLLLNGLKITRKIAGLKNAMKPIEKKEEKMSFIDYSVNLASSASYKLNVIGLYVEEALREVEAFLNRALVLHFTMVIIVHGQGSFKLKNAIWKLLSEKDYIKSYRLGQENEGGFGATVVYM